MVHQLGQRALGSTRFASDLAKTHGMKKRYPVGQVCD